MDPKKKTLPLVVPALKVLVLCVGYQIYTSSEAITAAHQM
jgi:hypothetical protein